MTAVRDQSLTTKKSRNRRTGEQYEQLDRAIIDVCRAERPITVRGVFYRVLTTGVIEKSEQEYGVVQRRVLQLRRNGRLPWQWITDGTRFRIKPDTWGSVDQMLADTASSYRRALWHDQDVYIEVWSEKDAISSVVSPITAEYDVPLMVARGYSSETFLRTSADEIQMVGKPTVIYQLGDHDPSGADAWRVIQEKLTEYAPGCELTFERLAVTPDQIIALELPTRPTKKSDSRSKNFSGESVEVDAIPSSILRDLVRGAIEQHIDQHRLEITRIVEEQERTSLETMAAGWSS